MFTLNSETRQRAVDLLADYQALTEAQAEEIRALRVENTRLQALIIDEIKVLALFVKGEPIAITAPKLLGEPTLAPARQIAPPKNFGETTCRCGARFMKATRLQQVCPPCKRESFTKRAQAARAARPHGTSALASELDAQGNKLINWSGR